MDGNISYFCTVLKDEPNLRHILTFCVLLFIGLDSALGRVSVFHYLTLVIHAVFSTNRKFSYMCVNGPKLKSGITPGIWLVCKCPSRHYCVNLYTII
jgi:hypothetical protein